MERSRIATDGAVVRSAVAALNRRLRREDDDVGIGPTALGILGLLMLEGAIGQSELAQREGLAPQSLTRPLNALVERGYVERCVDDTDHRRSILSISTSGRELYRATLRKRIRWLNAAMSRMLDDSERRTLLEASTLMDRLAGRAPREMQHPSHELFNFIPILKVRDVAASVAFYEKLGFVADARVERNGALVYASMYAKLARPARVMFERDCEPERTRDGRVAFYGWSDDVPALRSILAERGIETALNAENDCILDDADGYRIIFVEPRA